MPKIRSALGASFSSNSTARRILPSEAASASKRARALDFGLAVALEKGEQATDVYELTGETGSRRYMAPEVCLAEPYGVAVDVAACVEIKQ